MAEAELVQTGAPGEHDCQGHQERDRREDALRKLGHPENEHDQPVTADQLDQIASGTRCAGHGESMARQEAMARRAMAGESPGCARRAAEAAVVTWAGRASRPSPRVSPLWLALEWPPAGCGCRHARDV